MTMDRIVRPWSLVVALVVGACNGHALASQVLGPAEIPEGYQRTRVQDLVEDDKQWRDRDIYFEGAISKIGCGGCGGVIVADKTWRLSVEPADPSQFRIPVKTGARLKIWGVMRVTEDGFREVKAHRVEILDEEKKS